MCREMGPWCDGTLRAMDAHGFFVRVPDAGTARAVGELKKGPYTTRPTRDGLECPLHRVG